MLKVLSIAEGLFIFEKEKGVLTTDKYLSGGRLQLKKSLWARLS